MPTIFKAKPGSRIGQAKAQIYGRAILRIERLHGGTVSPEAIVEAASSPRSVLHSFFEWDDARAAERHRLSQARYLLRSIVMVPIVRGKAQNVRAFFNVVVANRGDRATAYVNVLRVGREKHLRAQVIAQALREAKAWRDRYGQYEELREISRAIERAIADQGKDRGDKAA